MLVGRYDYLEKIGMCLFLRGYNHFYITSNVSLECNANHRKGNAKG